jgi:hypothetical protein
VDSGYGLQAFDREEHWQASGTLGVGRKLSMGKALLTS